VAMRRHHRRRVGERASDAEPTTAAMPSTCPVT
jgi:hypothetical protein